MNLPDFPIFKFNSLSLDLKRLFDKGEIDKLYKKMYELAENTAARETKLYMDKTTLEWIEDLELSDESTETPMSHLSKIADYRNDRIQFHLDQMFKLLELYTKSKGASQQT